MCEEKIMEMIAELDRGKLEDSWIRKETFNRNEVIQKESCINEFIIVLEGVLHIENKNFHILHFFFGGDIVNKQLTKINEDNEFNLICDTEVFVVHVNREYFLNFATSKTVYLEWLIEKTLNNNKNLYSELIKNELTAEERIIYSLQHICDKAHINSEKQKIPSYMHKLKIAKYAGVFCTVLYEKLPLLIKKNILEERNGTLYLKKSKK
ncbi:Crp/Fnr family transcriptional regulator [Listeria ivanovii]|uniref:Cyclic nucleotide-binding domain-containing protein n=1 Tax=Listeria ivanovii TaxID=1638 RepID=A0AAX2DPD4_LISIV|nr:Crp/Fnr family transcriptional regulator [Listeria ivanovii]EFR96251.1 putative nucleotide-binding domain-containing protein [Listeria ivanovii FSL F6-596]MBK1966351.1 Crp/Fnr family transcriptional regulator [Listeria ivanovii subsp. londoniensis]MBK1983560.1 Crp/Fnr family transcriptional regulator [Listeria ivanovii subsp. londoniensis]MBK1995224.1 Crp/Fnr family transcriptional regulator [Listeria ivanovii subsp. londoniensis]SDW71639.1 hypothetical protein SAMN05421782_10611 [Listeria 